MILLKYYDTIEILKVDIKTTTATFLIISNANILLTISKCSLYKYIDFLGKNEILKWYARVIKLIVRKAGK